jgi:hypothetical protein
MASSPQDPQLLPSKTDDAEIAITTIEEEKSIPKSKEIHHKKRKHVPKVETDET